MKTVGFPISHKENEYRRAIVPAHLKNIEHPELLYFEKGYGVYNVQIKNSGHTLYAVLGDIPIMCFTIAVLTLLLIGCLCAVKKEWF